MLKKIFIGLAALLLVGAGGAYYLWSNLDSIVKGAIEKYGTAALQTEVGLDSVKLSVVSGEGTLSGLSVSNPKGFSDAEALSLGSIKVQVDTSSIRGTGPIVIREITIESPQVIYEIAADNSSNLQTIQHNAKAYAGVSGNNGGAESGVNRGQGRKIIIGDLYIQGGQVTVTHALLPGKPLSLQLPPIHLSNIGQANGGATAAQVAREILSSITKTTVEVAATGALARQLNVLKKQGISGLTNMLGSVTDSVSDAVSQGVDSVTGTVSDSVNGVTDTATQGVSGAADKVNQHINGASDSLLNGIFGH